MYNNHETQEKNQYLNTSDMNFNSEVYELTDDDLNNINGGAAGAGGSILDNVFHHKPIDWKSAAAWGIAGGIFGGIAGAALEG